MGRVIVPISGFDKQMEVLIFNETQLIGYGYTNGVGEYKLPEQPMGRYYIVVRQDGFQEYREKFDLWSCDKFFVYNLFLEPEEEEPVAVVLDFSGEVKEVVDIAELKRQFPRSTVDEFEKAQSDRLRGENPKARERLEKLIAQSPGFYDAHNVLGTIYLEAGEFRMAEKEYNTARELRPNSAAPLVSLGSLYLQEADATSNPKPGFVGVLATPSDLAVILDDARGVLEEAIKLKPDASFAYYLLGVAHYRSGTDGSAEEFLQRSLVLEPRLRWARLALANLYSRQQKWAEAVGQFDLYLKEFPKVSNRPEVEAARKKAVQQIPSVSG